MARKLVQANEDFFEEQKAKFNLVANSGLYSLPTDCLAVKQIRLAFTTPSTEGDYRVAGEYDASSVTDINSEEIDATTTNPLVDLTNNYFRVWPKPDTSITNGGEIYYIARPSALVQTSETPILPEEYHDLLSTYAAMNEARDFNLIDKYALLKNEWSEGLAKMIDEVQPRYTNRQERMRSNFEEQRGGSVTELWD